MRGGAILSLASALCTLIFIVLHFPVYFLLVPLFIFVSCVGITSTTSFTLAIAAQNQGAGSASGLLGVVSFIFGAAASPLVGLGGDDTALPMGISCALCALLVLLFFSMSKRKTL